jgi:hypothetical protein
MLGMIFMIIVLVILIILLFNLIIEYFLVPFLIIIGVIVIAFIIWGYRLYVNAKAKDELQKSKAVKYATLVEQAIKNKTLVNYPADINAFNINDVLMAISNRCIKLTYKSASHSEDIAIRIQNASLKAFSDFASLEEMINFSFVEITRSSEQSILVGSYIYRFDEDGNLFLLKSSFTLVDVNGKKYAYYDANSETRVLKINNEFFSHYKVYGSEMMKSTVKTTNTDVQVGLGRTMFSEILFGTSYTLLKGMQKNRMNISTEHSIEDTRHIQLIFQNNNDIVFQGIAIAYDLSRYVEEKSQNNLAISQKKDKLIDSQVKPQIETNKDTINRLRELKQLYNDEVISFDEFEELKSELINK